MYEGQLIDYHVESLHTHNYDSFLGELSELEEQFAQDIDVYSIGTSVEDRDIYAVDIYSGSVPPKETVYILAGQHGNEPSGPEAALEFIKRYVSSETEYASHLRDKVKITVVVAANVDQFARPEYDRGHRNMNDIDLNSSYRHLSNKVPETKAIAQHFESIDTPINLSFDLHETNGAWMKGFSIYENRPRRRRVLNLAEKAIEHVREEHPIHNNGVLHDFNPNCFDGFACDRKSYSYTFETPANEKFTIEDRVEMHLMGLDSIISTYFDGKYGL